MLQHSAEATVICAENNDIRTKTERSGKKIAKAQRHIIIDKVGYELNISVGWLVLCVVYGTCVYFVCVCVVFGIKYNGFGDIIIRWLRFVSSDGHSNWVLSFLIFIVIVFVFGCSFGYIHIYWRWAMRVHLKPRMSYSYMSRKSLELPDKSN